jgi:hypothetical protein
MSSFQGLKCHILATGYQNTFTYLLKFFTLCENWKRVKRQEPFTEADLQELQVFTDVYVLHVICTFKISQVDVVKRSRRN